MKTLIGAALAAFLVGGTAAAVRAEGAGGRVQLAQMDSAGDGLDGRRAVRQGNARPYRLDSMGGRAMNRLRRSRHHRHHRRYR